MAQKNTNLHKAKSAKNDEFYTQLTDIEKELKYYKHHFEGKTVFCNCDDPTWSEFWRYFHLNFSELGLKKLISTHYDPEQSTYKLEYTGGDDNNIEAGVKTPLAGNGDFRSDECIALLKEADICCTNPPFSHFRSFVAQLIEHNKKFIIIGNVNAVSYREIFTLIKNNKLWAGYSFNKAMCFNMPDSYEGKTLDANGKKIAKVPAIAWYTNLDITKRNEDLILWKTYTPEEFPKYDNYDAINVNKTVDIPVDYEGYMGVPITFLDKYNPHQFEIIGLLDGSHGDPGIPTTRSYDSYKEIRQDKTLTGASGKKINGNPVMQGPSTRGNYYVSDNSYDVHSLYARIVIRRVKRDG